MHVIIRTYYGKDVKKLFAIGELEDAATQQSAAQHGREYKVGP